MAEEKCNVLGSDPVITLSDLQLHPEDHAAVAEALASNWLTMGPRTEAFERAFALALDPDDPPHCFAVTNCTAALHMALVALGVGPGDEVILPSLTFVATANAVLYTGATAVLADVTSALDLTLSTAAAKSLITDKTRAILPVHYAGRHADLAGLQTLGVAILEDNAHGPLADGVDAQGRVRALGSIGAIGCFSFFSNKNMATGEGGMVVTRDDTLADKLRLLRSHGMTTLTLQRHRGHAFSYDVVLPEYNYRIDELRSALGLSQLSRLADHNAVRARVTDRYFSLLARIDGLIVPFADHPQPGRAAPHILPVVLPQGVDRTAIQTAMRAAGVQTSVHYPPIHTFTHHSTSPLVRTGPMTVTDAIADRLLTLPLYPTLTDADQDRVVESLAAAIQGARS